MIRMATTERPPVKIDGKRNPKYDEWYREQKKAASVDNGDGTKTVTLEVNTFERDPTFQSAAEPEQTTIDDLREPEVAPALEPLSLRVLKLAKNQHFVLCESPAKDGTAVAVKVKRGSGRRMLKKSIHVEAREEEGETKYYHAR